MNTTLSIPAATASAAVRSGVPALSAAVVESICEYTDGQRADGVSYAAVCDRLRSGGGAELAGLSAGWIEKEHKAWQRERMKELQVSRRRDVGVEELELGAVALTGGGASRGMGTGSAGTGGEDVRELQFSDEVRGLVTFLGRDLLQGRPSWQFARHRALRKGESFQRHAGPGEMQGQEWRMGAVSIWRESETGARVLVEILPEHRIKRVLPVAPPKHCSETLRLDVFTLADVGRVKVAEALLEIQVQLARKKLPESVRARLVLRKKKLDDKLAAEGGRDAAASVLRIQQVVSRLAVVMHLYADELTGIESGSQLGAASGKTRAAISAAKLKLVEWDTGRSGGRAGFAGVRAARVHREAIRGREVGDGGFADALGDLATKSTEKHREKPSHA